MHPVSLREAHACAHIPVFAPRGVFTNMPRSRALRDGRLGAHLKPPYFRHEALAGPSTPGGLALVDYIPL